MDAAWLRRLLDACEEAILVVEPVGGTCLLANPAAANLFQLDHPDALLGRPLRDLVAELPSRSGGPDPLAGALRLARSEGSRVVECLMRDALHRQFLGRVRLRRMTAESTELIHVAIRDVTAQRAADLHLLRLASAVEQAHESVVITDPNGVIQYVNPHFERVSGYTAEEAIGQRPSLLKSGRQDAGFYAELWKCILAGQTWRGRFVNRRKDGTLYHEDATVSPILDGGVIRHFVAVKRDVTREIELEGQLLQAQKLEAIGRLAAGIAHEINTPAQFVSDNLYFVSETLDEGLATLERLLAVGDARALGASDAVSVQPALLDALRELPAAVEQARQGVARIIQIVSAMKDFGRPADDTMTQADLNRLVTSTVTVCRNEWKYVAELTTDLDPALPTVTCFVHEIGQVLMNLVVNAAHAIADTGAGRDRPKGRITVTTRSCGDEVEIAVADTGTGIPEHARDRIFEPFYSTKEVGKGTGQGLAIARSIVVDKHRGRIGFRTEVGQGTTFTVRLPVERPVEASRSAA